MPRTSSAPENRPAQFEQAGIALEQVAEEAAGGQQRTHPERGADAVKKQKAAKAHAVLAGDGRSQRGQAGHELGNHQRDAAAAAKGVLGSADADGRLQRELAEDAQHMVAVSAADEEPGAVGRERGGQRRPASARGKLSWCSAESAPAASSTGVAGSGMPNCSTRTQAKSSR